VLRVVDQPSSIYDPAMTPESVIARTVAHELDGAARQGVLVLTTDRLVFVIEDAVAYEIHRDHIGRVYQDLSTLRVTARGETVGVGFRLGSALAGPVRWDWYLQPPTTTSRRRGEWMPALPGDPRIGPVDPARRAVLDKWEGMMSFVTIRPIDHYLDELPPEPVQWANIIEIVYIADGRGDGPSWILVVRLADGRWVYFSHQVDITGEVYTTRIVARSLESLWWGALSEDERDRVTAQITPDRLEEELVKLDSLLESPEPNVRQRAEARMLQIKAPR